MCESAADFDTEDSDDPMTGGYRPRALMKSFEPHMHFYSGIGKHKVLSYSRISVVISGLRLYQIRSCLRSGALDPR